MKALICRPPGVEFVENAPEPEINTSESRVRVYWAGICRTDLELTKGYMGFEGILGHEFVGVVDDDASPLPRGARVVGEINAGCGRCEWCASGMERHCPNRTVLGILKRGGCMAERLTLPHENLLPVPKDVPDRVAVFTEPLAAALEIFEQIHIEPIQRVCILGDGKLGLLIAMTFGIRHEGPVVLLGRHHEKLKTVEDLVEVHLENQFDATMNKQWDYVVDATGSSSGLNRAMQLVKPRGTIVLKSTMAHAEALDLTPLVIDEVTVVGSRCGRFAPALEFLARRKPPVERLIDAEFPIEQARAAWDRASARGVKKVLLKVNAE
ncbi:MAG: alcohol dehydrogenase catalytic domain-containing protein [bacterium]|nr:alcohol dehydrogenase catalytic domain-containing protein [bacterium]